MKQTEIIAQLRSLRESQADFARTNGDEIFKRDVEALDAAIEALGFNEYYINQNGRVKRGHVCELFETDDGDDLLGLVDDRGRQIHGLWEFDSFRRCELYDNETDCRNQTHGAYDDWERLRRIQEGENG